MFFVHLQRLGCRQRSKNYNTTFFLMLIICVVTSIHRVNKVITKYFAMSFAQRLKIAGNIRRPSALAIGLPSRFPVYPAVFFLCWSIRVNWILHGRFISLSHNPQPRRPGALILGYTTPRPTAFSTTYESGLPLLN